MNAQRKTLKNQECPAIARGAFPLLKDDYADIWKGIAAHTSISYAVKHRCFIYHYLW